MDCGKGSLPHPPHTHQPPPPPPPPACPPPPPPPPHAHPDHSVDIYGLHVMYKYGLECSGLPIYAPEGVEKTLEGLVGEWTDTFEWNLVGDGDRATIGDAQLQFSRTDHPLPTMGVDLEHGGKRLVYTADTGPKWSVET